MEVKVYSPQMGEKIVTSSATTWGALQSDLRSQGISYNKMKAVIGETRHTLEADGASLPEQGFTLFLMNKKTKAGLGKEFNSYKYGQLRGTVRVILTDDPSSADLFNKTKNYTTKKGDELLAMLKKYKGSVPNLSTVEKFLAEAKANKGKKAPAKPKVTKVAKNEVKEPARGFGADSASQPKKEETTPKPKKKNSIISKAQAAVEEIEVKAPTTVADVLDNVKKDLEDKEVSPVVTGLVENAGDLVGNALEVFNLEHAYAVLKEVNLKKVDKGIHKQLKTVRLEVKEVLNSVKYIVKKEAEALAFEAEKEQKRIAEEEAKKAEDKRLADIQAKEEAEAEAKEAAAAEEKEAHAEEMKSEFDDIFSEFGDVKR
jgi:hypothetical protein